MPPLELVSFTNASDLNRLMDSIKNICQSVKSVTSLFLSPKISSFMSIYNMCQL